MGLSVITNGTTEAERPPYVAPPSVLATQLADAFRAHRKAEEAIAATIGELGKALVGVTFPSLIVVGEGRDAMVLRLSWLSEKTLSATWVESIRAHELNALVDDQAL